MTYIQLNYLITSAGLSFATLYLDMAFLKGFYKMNADVSAFCKKAAYIIYFIVKLMQFHIVVPSIVNAIISFGITLSLTFLYNVSPSIRITSLITKYIFTAGVNMLLTYNYSSHLHASFQSNVVLLLSQLFIVKLYQMLSTSHLSRNNSGKLHPLVIIVLSPTSILILYLLYISGLEMESGILSVVTIGVLIQNVAFYIIYDKVNYASQIEYHNQLLKDNVKYYEATYHHLKNKIDIMNKFKHNLKYEIEYLSVNTHDIKEKLLDMADKITENGWVVYTNIYSIDMLLNEKVTSCDLEIDIKTSKLADISCEKDLYIILSNLIDNAIENYDESCSTQKSIQISLFEKNSSVYVEVSNPYSQNITLKNNIPITNKIDTSIHGFGLKSVEMLVNENNGQFKISIKNNIFTVKVIILSDF